MTRTAPDLTCRELVELVTDYLEARMSVEERTRFELHLPSCDACRIYLRQMRLVRASAGRLPRDAIAAGARAALLEAFRGWKATRGEVPS